MTYLDLDQENRHTLDSLDAQRVLANVSRGLFEREADRSRVGRFVLLDKLGAGGMGVVYSAFDPKLDRRVAIKVLHRGDESGERAQGRQERLRAEARALAKLSHPNVVTIYEVGEVDDQVFLAMELVDGEPLDAWIEHDRTWKEIVQVFMEAGRGLAAAHEQGLVHRDFKPSNVVLGADGRVTVLDFGLARTVEVPLTLDSARVRAGVAAPEGLTDSRIAVGTPLYMSPEQFEGADVGHKSDQFSLCVSMFEALFGMRPFHGTTLAEIAERVTSGTRVEAPRKSDVPQWLHAVLDRGLSVRPEDRYPSMDALLLALEGPPRRWWTPRPSWIGPGAIAVVAAVVVALPDAPTGAQCDDGRQRFERVWSEPHRAAVEAAFADTKKPYASDAYEGATQALDDYLNRWASAHDDACAATHIRGEQSEALLDRRMMCLDERLAAVDGLVEVLASADSTVVHNAVSAAHKLPRLDACADVAGLLGQGSGLAPEQQQQRARWLEAVARAVSKRQAGRYNVAQRELEAVLAEVGDLDRLVRSDAAMQLGVLQERAGEHEQAEQSLKQALWDAVAEDDVTLQLRAAVKLMTVVGWQQRRTKDGRDWKGLADALLRRSGEPRVHEAAVESAYSNLLYAEGDFAAAVEHKSRALELQEELRQPNDPRLAVLHSNLGSFHGNLGNADESLMHHRRAVELRLASLGPAHPRTALAYNALAGQLRIVGQLEESLATFEKAIVIWRDVLGPDHVKLAMAHTNMANTLATMGRDTEAIAGYHEAIRIWSGGGPSQRSRLASARTNLGIVLIGQQRLDEGVEQLERAVAAYGETIGVDHADTGPVHINLSIGYRKQGDAARALASARQAIAVIENNRTKEHPLYPQARTVEAQALGLAGRVDEAVVAAEEAVEIYGRIEAPEPDRADAEYVLAQVLVERDGAAASGRARELAGAAIARLASLEGQVDRRAAIARWRDTLP